MTAPFVGNHGHPGTVSAHIRAVQGHVQQGLPALVRRRGVDGIELAEAESNVDGLVPEDQQDQHRPGAGDWRRRQGGSSGLELWCR